ncbi:unnamed protein product [Rhizoctonia solani]|uniref:SprT-like domain-containing protein n=1 Tax=Rhizoctonia solani TaxID=456999 RepID=A0A8H3HF89_9AGAM|nr:unnamed protein product [Rhizoctonia solani]
MPREADINTRFEAGSSEEGTPLDPAKSSLFTVGASNYANVKVVHRKTDGLRFPRRTHGASYRNRVIVISDSESDSELPSPSQLLQGRDLVGPASNLGSLASTNEIIEISSDSEIEATPTKPRGGKSSSSTQGYPTTSAVSPSSTSVSALAGAFHDSLFVHTTRSPSRAESVGHPQSDGTTPLSQPTEANSTDSEELDETKFFDPDASHPGILLFNPGPRKPALVTSSLGTPISTQKTSDHSQDLCGEGRARTSIQADDSCEDIEEIKNPNKSAKSRGATGNGKASNSGYRSQIRNDIEGTVLPETPRPRARPKPKARSVALTSELASVSLSPKPAPRNQAKVLQAAAILLFAELNSSVFGGKLPKDCPIEWSKKLNTTAGRAHWKRIRDANGNVARHDTRIELSTKVVDCEGFSDTVLLCSARDTYAMTTL